MKDWESIAKALNEELPEVLVNEPDQQRGIFGHWIAGSVAMELANEVFGPDGWSTAIVGEPTIEVRVVGAGEGGVVREAMEVRTIIQVTAKGLDNGVVVEVTKTDVGFGTAMASYDRQSRGYNPIKSQQVRTAIMGSVTIGIKRCLHQFGRKLGMQLYISGEDDMAALGWTEGEEESPTAPVTTKKPEPSTVGDDTDLKSLAEFYSVPLEGNEEALKKLAEREAGIDKLDIAALAGTPKIKEVLGKDKATLGEIYVDMPSYFVWMASVGDTDRSASPVFVNAFSFDQQIRLFSAEIFRLQGGEYVPWEAVGIQPPTVMIGYGVEKTALGNAAFRQALIDRFPDDSGEDVNGFHFKNHLTKHFQVERIGLMTWEQLAAFRAHILDGTEYPQRYGREQPAEAPPPQQKGPFDWNKEIMAALSEIDGHFPEEGVSDEAAKVHSLDTELALKTIQSIRDAVSVQDGGLRSRPAVVALLTTALRALPGAIDG